MSGARWPARRTMVVVALACVALIAALYVVAVHTGWGQHLDESAIRHHRYDRTSGRDARRYDAGLILLLAGLGAVVAALTAPRWRLMVVLGGSIGGAVVLANVLRRIVLDRPTLGVFDLLYGPSFPSGHATAAVTIAGALLVVCPGRPWVRRGVAVLIAGSVDGLILFIPIHRPSDIAAGNLLGLAVLCLALGWFGGALHLPTREPGSGRWWDGPLAFAWLAAVEIVVLLAVLSRLAHRSDLSIRAYGAGFVVGVIVDVVSAATVLAVFELLLGRMEPVRTPAPAGGP